MSTDRPLRGSGSTPPHDPMAVGAYLLGTLDPAERDDFERHLARCSECRAELAELEPLPGLLDRVDLADLEEPPPAGDELFGRITAAIGADRERQHRRRRARVFLAGAAAVVAAGGTAAGVVLSSGTGALPAQTFSVSDGHMHMTVRLAGEASGTGLDVSVSGLPDGVHCRLIAVSASGRRQVAGSWSASYGGAAHVTGLETSFRPKQLSRIVLRISGTSHRLAVDV
jgi:hypothetical protein